MRRLYSGRVRRVSGKFFDQDIAATTQQLIAAAGHGGGDEFYRRVVDGLARRLRGHVIEANLLRCMKAVVEGEARALRLSPPDGSLAGGVEMRRRARAIAGFAATADSSVAGWAAGLEQLVAVIDRALPAEPKQQRGYTVNVPLVEAMLRPFAVLDELVAMLLSWHDDVAFSVRPGGGIARRVMENVLDVSRLSEEEARRLPRRVIRPSASKLTAGEAVECYLAGTPLVELLLDTHVPVVVGDDQLVESGAIIARIGHGKSQVIEDLFDQLLLQRGRTAPAAVVMDSQRDLIRRLSRLKFFAPGEPGEGKLVVISPRHLLALNIFDFGADRLAKYDAFEREGFRNRSIELLTELFASLLSAGTTERQSLGLQFMMDVMVDMPGANMETLKEMLRDPAAFVPQIEACSVPDAREFLLGEWLHEGQYRQVRRELLWRVWGALASPLRPMLTAPHTRFDLGQALQSGKVILVDTDLEHLGRERSSLFGKYLVMLLKMAVWMRASIPEKQRRPALVVIDEAHEYATGGGDKAMENFIIQSRKYRVGLVFTSQKLDQYSSEMQGVIAAQVGFKLIGAVSASDAHKLAPNMGIAEEQLTGLTSNRRGAEWVLHLRKGGSGRGVKVGIAHGALNNQPSMSEAEFAALMAGNQRRYGVEVVAAPRGSDDTQEYGDDWRS